MKKKQIVVGFSGGVDSAAATLLLKEKGYEVFAVTFDFFGDSKTIYRASALAKELGLVHQVINLQIDFKKRVIDPFVQDYMNGLTPNPCIRCDEVMKFASLFAYANSKDIFEVATGHYLNIEAKEDGFHLFKNSNDRKDQSYFLYRLDQNQLKRLVFPLGGFHDKSEVRRYVQSFGVEIPPSEESQGICFIPDNNYSKFIKKLIPLMPPGRFKDIHGKILGSHNGFYHFTIGQKKGLNINTDPKYVVIALRPDTNVVILGQESALYQSEIYLEQLHFIANKPIEGSVTFKICRFGYLYKGNLCLKGSEDGILLCEKPVRAPAPGQSVVFYQNSEVMGGGVIV